MSSSRSPREALRLWLIELAAYGQLKRGISQVVLAAATRQGVATTWRPRVLGAVQALLVAFLWQTPISPERAERLTSVLIGGPPARPAR